jgi:predicted nucleic acid-binding protein
LIYVDTSVVLAHLLADDKTPPPEFWEEFLVSSRLLEYEVWNRIHAKHLHESHAELVRTVLSRMAWLELISPILSRAVEPFPLPLRPLDALHLASLEFLRSQSLDVTLATYDSRMLAAARKMKIPGYPL